MQDLGFLGIFLILLALVVGAIALLMSRRGKSARQRAQPAETAPAIDVERPRPKVAEFHVRGEEAQITFDVPLPEGDIDEVRLYDQALSDRLVIRHFADREVRAGMEVAVRPRLHYSARRLLVGVLCRGLTEAGCRAEVSLRPPGGPTLQSSTEPLRETRPDSERWPAASAPWGTVPGSLARRENRTGISWCGWVWPHSLP